MGPAFLLPNAIAILGRTYKPGRRKNMVFSLFGASAPGGFVLGAVFSSMLGQLAWWPWAYWIMGIACFVLAVAGYFVIPHTPMPSRDASSFKLLERIDFAGSVTGIRTPFIALHAQDDPIVGGDLPIDQIKSNPYTLLLETSTGGHVGWFKDRSGRRWYAEPLCRFLKIFHDEITVKGLKPDLENVQLPDPNCEPIATTFRAN